MMSGDETSHKLTDRDFNLVKLLTDFDEHLIEHDLLLMDEVYPFILITREELNPFKARTTCSKLDCTSPLGDSSSFSSFSLQMMTWLLKRTSSASTST